MSGTGAHPLRAGLLHALKFAAVASILLLVIRYNGGRKLLRTFLDVKGTWVGLSALLFLLSIVAGALQWRLLLRIQGQVIGWRGALGAYWAGLFTGALVFNVAGDALRVYKLKRSGIELMAAFLATFLDRFMGLAILSLFAVTAVSFAGLFHSLHVHTQRTLFAATFAVFMGFAGGGAVLASRRAGAVFHWLLGYMKLHWAGNIYARVQDGLHTCRREWRRMAVVAGLSALVHTLRILGHWACAAALDIQIPLYFFFVAIPIVSLATMVPLNVGGWGLPQGIGVTLYSLPGIIGAIGGSLHPDPETVRIASGSLTFLPSIVFYLIMLLGGFFLFGEPGRREREST